MFTLKIKWMRYETDDEYARIHPDASPQTILADETTLFIAANQVDVHGEIKGPDEMKAWESGSYLNYAIDFGEEHPTQKYMRGTRLIHVIQKDGSDGYYLASLAWLLGPDGKTIEKLTT